MSASSSAGRGGLQTTTSASSGLTDGTATQEVTDEWDVKEITTVYKLRTTIPGESGFVPKQRPPDELDSLKLNVSTEEGIVCKLHQNAQAPSR